MTPAWRKALDELIKWAVPAVCAGLLALWHEVPLAWQHYWPVCVVALQGVYSMWLALQTRSEVKSLRAIHERADAKEAEAKARDDATAKAFRAMLDDDMGKLYALCSVQGYTTEDERRRYNRLQVAYEAVGGNGEAKRRKEHFNALPDEETWNAHNQ